MEGEEDAYFIFINNGFGQLFPGATGNLEICFAIILLLLIASFFISGSEVAFFSLSNTKLNELKESGNKKDRRIVYLVERPEVLLASIIVIKNLLHTGIAAFLLYLAFSLLVVKQNILLYLFILTVLITAIIILFGEVIPKMAAGNNPLSFSRRMSATICFLNVLCKPVSHLLINNTSIVNRIIRKKQLTIDELSEAIDVSSVEQENGDNTILKGILKFNNIDVRDIMKSRVDITAINVNHDLENIVSVIVDSGYSRIPVYEENFDQVRGILYVKDLIPKLSHKENFNWQKLTRPPYFVTENTKIDVLLKQFQSKKMHMAIVMDEYGGTSGIVTLEDIIEEIVGEISDEYDEEEFVHYKINDKNFIFEGKTSLNDFFKIVNVNDEAFDDVKGDAETLAGLILEINGELPGYNQTISYKNFEFIIKSVDERRIKRIRVKIN